MDITRIKPAYTPIPDKHVQFLEKVLKTFNEGNLTNAYEYLGANVTEIGGIKGSTYVIKGKDEKITLIIKHSKKYYGTLNDRELIKLLGINKNTYYKYLKEITTADVDRYDQYNNR